MACRFYSRYIDQSTATAMLAAVEGTLPTTPLVYRITPAGKCRLVPNPGSWCALQVARNIPGVICNGNEQEMVSLFAVMVPAISVPGGESLTVTHIRLPWKIAFVEKMLDLVAAFGSAARAFWGGATLPEAANALTNGAGRTSEDPGFPRPMSPSVLIPHLDWISYWSNDTCEYLRFSLDDARASLFARVIQVDGQGVVLQLTEDPLDLERPEHLFALERVYKAFPEIDSKWGL